MKLFALWLIMAIGMTAALVYEHAGPTTLALCFFAWAGGVVSLLTLQKLRRLHG